MATLQPNLAMIKLVKPTQRNVLGGALEVCSTDPLTGFFRDGCCSTDEQDEGSHTICVKVTEDFLAFSAGAGNDLSTPHPEYMFPGLKPNDQWCLCAARWAQAFEMGVAPRVVLEATHERALDVVPLADLKAHAIPG
jgi:uncharacterized protein (DUF2237 family)